MPLVSLVSMTSMVWSPSRSLMVLVVDASLPPRKSQLSQLPAMVSQSSLYRLLPWETVCRMIEQLMPRERMVVFCQVVIGQCGVSFPSEKAVGFSPVRNWPVIARVLLFHCIRA